MSIEQAKSIAVAAMGWTPPPGVNFAVICRPRDQNVSVVVASGELVVGSVHLPLTLDPSQIAATLDGVLWESRANLVEVLKTLTAPGVLEGP